MNRRNFISYAGVGFLGLTIMPEILKAKETLPLKPWIYNNEVSMMYPNIMVPLDVTKHRELGIGIKDYQNLKQIRLLNLDYPHVNYYKRLESETIEDGIPTTRFIVDTVGAHKAEDLLAVTKRKDFNGWIDPKLRDMTWI